jgi:hypothetical protein
LAARGNQLSTQSEAKSGGVHAVSLDYGEDFLKFFCVMADDVDREELDRHFAQRRTPFLLPSPLKLRHLGARLGPPMQAANEVFSPFQLVRAQTIWGEYLGDYPEPEFDEEDSSY